MFGTEPIAATLANTAVVKLIKKDSKFEIIINSNVEGQMKCSYLQINGNTTKHRMHCFVVILL